MSVIPVNAAVVHDNTIVKAEVLTAGKAVKIKAIPGAKYVLAEGENGVAPENITLRRVGKNLHVILEGSDIEHPELIIEGFYDHPGELVGKGEDGQWHEYIATSGEEKDDAAFLMDGEISGVALGANTIAGLDGLAMAATAISPALIALGMLGALAAAAGLGYLAGRRDSDDNANSRSGGGEGDAGGIGGRIPSVGSVIDDFGSITGPLNSGDVTDDSTPTFNGSGTPGNTIEIWDGETKLGEVAVGGDGSWSYTPPPLEHGNHTIIIVERDPEGNTSLPSEGFELIIDLEAPDRAELNEVWDDVAPGVGPVENDGSTNDQQPEFRGKAEPNATVEIILNGEVVKVVPVDANGDWTWTPDAPLPEGHYSVELVVVDTAGNPSLTTPPFNFEVDITPPVMVPGAFDLDNVIDDVGLKTGPISSGDITDDNRPTFNGGGLVPGNTVEVHDSVTGELVGTTIVKADGSWTFTPEADMSEGPHSISIIIVDPAQNRSEPSPAFEFTVDTVPPPKPTGSQFEGAWDDVGEIVGQIEAGSSTDDSRPEFKGTGLTPGHIVHIREDFFGEMGTAIVDANGNWTWTPEVDSPLSNGDYVFEIVIEDEVGRVSEPSDPLDFTVDLTPPGQPLITELWDDQGAVTGPIDSSVPTDDAQPEIRGTADAGSKVWVYIDGVLEGTVMADADGSWTFTPERQLSNGAHIITAQASDSAGNRGQVSEPFDLIVQAGGIPDSPAITGVIDNVAGGIVGNIAPGGVTNDPRPEVQGTAPAGTVVNVTIDGVSIGSVTADADGRWSIVSDRDLATGEHVIVAEAVNGLTPPSGEYIIHVDVTAPAAAGDLELIDDVPDIVGPINSGDTTDDRTPTFNGTAEPDAIVYIRDNGVIIGSVRTEDDGSWSWTTPPLSEGEHSFDVIVADQAGNESQPSTPIDFIVDTSAVLIAIDSATDNVGAIQGPLSNGAVTDDATPTLRGQATPNALVTIYVDGTAVGSVMANGRGEWTHTPTLTEGEHRITATVTTPAGGESAPTGEFVLIVDLTPPAKPAIDAILDDVGHIQGPLANPAITDDPTPTLTGSNVEPHALVIIYNNGQRIGSQQADADGNWRWTPDPGLNEGRHEFSVAVQDQAGWISERSDSWVIEVDTVAPGIPSTGPGGALEGAWDDVGPHTGLIDDLTDDDRPTFAGGGLEPGDTVEIWDDFGGNKQIIGTAIVDEDGNWNFTPEPGNELDDGDHAVSIIIVEPSGQRSPESEAIEFEVDTVAPAAPVITGVTDANGPVTGGSTDDPHPLISGTAEADALIEIYDTDGTLLGTAQADAGGNWSFRPERPLAQGEHALTATAQDKAGNTSLPSNPFDLALVGGGITPDVAIVAVLDDELAHVGPIQQGGLTNDATPTVQGTGTPGTVVHLFDGNTFLNSVTVGADGRWSLTTPALASGEHTLSARPVLADGTLGQATGGWTITVDLDAPDPASDVTLWDDENDNPAVEVPQDGTTDDPTPTLKGKAEEGATVIVRDQDGNVIGTDVADANGDWSVTPTTPLEDGDHSLTVEVVDAAGNSGGERPAIDFTLDTSGRVVSITHVADDEGALTGDLASGSRTDDTTPVVHGRATPNSVVTVLVDGVAVGSVQTNAFGHWALELTLSEGTYSITASVTAPGGATTVTSPFELSVDTTGPARAVIDNVVDDVGAVQGNLTNPGRTDDSTPTLQGRGTPGETVNVYVDGVKIDSVPVNADGSWNYTLPPQQDGTYEIEVSFSDDVGIEGPRSEAWEVTVDTVPPAGAITGAANDNDPSDIVDVVNGGWTNDTTPVLRGTGEAGAVVTLHDANGTARGSAIVGADGTWRVTVAPALAEASHTLTATFDDGVHQTVSAPWVVNVDTTAPPAGTISEIIDNFGPVTGAIGRDGITDDRTPTLRGTGEPLSWVYIYDGNGTVVLGSVQVGANGRWEVELAPQNDGTYNFTAAFVDRAGNAAPARADSWPITIDTVPPTGAITGVVNDNDPLNPVTVANGGLTNDPTPLFSGTGEAGTTVTLHDANGTPRGSAIVGPNGTWQVTVSPALGEGSHRLTATFDDGANQTVTAPWVVNIDTVAPTGAITDIIDDFGAVTGSIGSGGRTDDNTPTLTGTTEPLAMVYIYDGVNPTPVASMQAGADGRWSITVPVQPDGTYTFQAEFVDPANNSSGKIDAWPITIDTVPPVGAITGVVNDIDPSNPVAVANGGWTKDTTPVFSGTGEAGTTVTLHDANGVARGSAIVQPNGTWQVTVAPALAEASHNLTATFDDGVNQTVTAPWAVNVDTTAPTGTITDIIDDFGAVTGSVGANGRTDDNTPTLTGTTEALAMVYIYDSRGGNPIASVQAGADGRWSVTLPTQPDGTYTYQAQFVDRANNASGKIDAWPITIDTVAPVGAITGVVNDIDPSNPVAIANGGWTKDTTPVFSGTGEAGTTVTLHDANGVARGSAVVQPNGTWQVTVAPALAEGSHGLTATFDDGANQTVTAPWAVNVDTTAPTGTITDIIDDFGAVTGSVGANGRTDDNTPTLTGTTDALAMVYIYDSRGGNPIASVQAGADGRWSVTLPAQPDGTYTYQAQFVDRANNASGKIDAWPITIDTVPPVGAITGVVNDNDPSNPVAVANGGLTNDSTPVFSGTGEAGTTVTLHDANGTPRGSAIVQPNGTWQVTVAPALAEASHTLTATFDDGVHQTVTAPWAVSVDMTPPTGTITDIIDDFGTVTGSVGANGRTDDNTPTLTGTTEALAMVYIYDSRGGNPIASVQAGADGRWSVALPAQPDGTYTYQAQFVDRANNASGKVDAWPITIDTVPPVGAITGVLNDNDPANPVAVTNGGLTNDPTPVFSGTGEAGTTVTLRDANGTARGSAIVQPNGTWQVTVAPALAEASHTLTATFDDGLHQTVTAPWVINVDTTPPTGTITDIIDDYAGARGDGATGSIPVNGRTDDNTPTLTGTTEALAMVYIYDSRGGNPIASVQAGADGRWSVTLPAQRDGTYIYQAQFVDRANNASGKVDAWSFTIDTTPPAVGSITGLFDDAGASTGLRPNTGAQIVTDDMTPEIRGSGGVVGDLVILWSGNTAVGSVVVTAADGTWSITPALANNATHNLTATFEDDLGNRSGHTAPVQVRIEPDAPVAPVYAGVAEDWESYGGAGSFNATNGRTFGGGMFQFTSGGGGVSAVGYSKGTNQTGHVLPNPNVIQGESSWKLNYALQTANPNASSVLNNFRILNGGVDSLTIEMGIYTNIPTNPVTDHRIRFRDSTGRVYVGLANPYVSYIPVQYRTALWGVGNGVNDPINATVYTWRFTITPPKGVKVIEFGYETFPGLVSNVWDISYGTYPSTLQTFAGDEEKENEHDIAAALQHENDSKLTPVLEQKAEQHLEQSLAQPALEDGLLILDGADQVIDLSNVDPAQQRIEVIDITGSGDNTLHISLGDILAHGDKDLFIADGSVQLMINGDEGDVVNLDDMLNGTDPGDWAKETGVVEVAGVRYEVYKHSTVNAELLVQEGVQTNLI
ncbi:hypothetical protein HX773_21280 [Pantoea sp. B9002]|uniref:Ig-like domain-containing protein n=1 Tax=Pantoea sp. B9002 TaxID=2726979 RepID=UPI0015A4BD32|nr:Ig-like domain-containing protein [Pantoea sp. B9002]NWA63441.1 hypothetical protein [Pantoea sp. B9002]